jgi:hypothetical protein
MLIVILLGRSCASRGVVGCAAYGVRGAGVDAQCGLGSRDLMRVRRRLSKLLLRQGRVYSGGQAWTGPHQTWLRQQRFTDAIPQQRSTITSTRSYRPRRRVITSMSRLLG